MAARVVPPEARSARLVRDDAARTASPSNVSSPWWLSAAWIGLLAVALAVRLPFVLRVGTTEGGADEWYAVWRAWSVLFERGNPGNFLRPALFYEAGAACFSGLYLVGRASGTFHSAVDLLTSPDVERVRTCAAAACAWLFLDTTKNRARCWCDMKTCGNREKVRRFRSA